MVCGNTFAKTICSICYEDLKPIVEDLQSISICGHVFHELCIQQWFEYCSNGKKKNCPVCKQTCSEANVGRLYFQSVGDPILSSQKPINCEENPAELRREVEKLEGKVLGLSSALERQQKDVKELSKELCFSKELAKKESGLKNEALEQIVSIQQLLHLKSEELDRSTLDCMRLQERNMALAKELAALKLASDCNLEEEEVLKLASLGNGANKKDTVDILKKTLVIRNKSYKELMSKCNILGRGEARSLRKLEKTKDKIKKLKVRIQELETALEVKDNKVLRSLKASKKTTCEGAMLNDVCCNLNLASTNKCLNYRFANPAELNINLDQNGSASNDLLCPRKIKEVKPSTVMGRADNRDGASTAALDEGTGFHFLMDDQTPEISNNIYEVLQRQVGEDLAVRNFFPKQQAAADAKTEAIVLGPRNKDGVSGTMSGSKGGLISASSNAIDEDAVLILDDIKQVQPFLRMENETPCPVPISQPGDPCFSGSLLGPDGSKRHLGKWCRRAQDKASTTSSEATQGSTGSGSLIAVGADGRGGRIKVLRSLDQSSSDGRDTSTLGKRCRYGDKTSSLQSRGCLQIEHFFRRAGQ